MANTLRFGKLAPDFVLELAQQDTTSWVKSLLAVPTSPSTAVFNDSTGEFAMAAASANREDARWYYLVAHKQGVLVAREVDFRKFEIVRTSVGGQFQSEARSFFSSALAFGGKFLSDAHERHELWAVPDAEFVN